MYALCAFHCSLVSGMEPLANRMVRCCRGKGNWYEDADVRMRRSKSLRMRRVVLQNPHRAMS